MKTVYAWVCCRRGCSVSGFYPTKWPDPGAFIYRAPTCPCGAPMQANRAGGTKQVPTRSRDIRKLL